MAIGFLVQLILTARACANRCTNGNRRGTTYITRSSIEANCWIGCRNHLLKKVIQVEKKNFLFDKTMGRLMRKIRKLGNRRKRSRSETTGRDCANCTALRTKVDGELFLAAR